MSSKWWLVLAASGVLALGVAACGDDDDDGGGDGGSGEPVSGTIRIDGSSTVAPLTQAIAEGFNEENPDVNVTVGTSGTGGGFEKFCAGETDANDASEAIGDEEIAACEQGGVEYEELQVANDALTVVVNPENPVTCMTVDQLKSVWEPKSTISSWSDIQGLEPPYDETLDLYGPGSDSGTFGYFTEAINGEEDAIRNDYNDVGEDDNATVTGVSGAPGGMGYFGYSFFAENEDTLKALEIDGGTGLRRPVARDRSGRQLHAAEPAAVHLPVGRRAGRSGVRRVHAVLPRQRQRHRRAGRVHRRSPTSSSPSSRASSRA